MVPGVIWLIMMDHVGPVQMPLFLFDDDPELKRDFAWSSVKLARWVVMHPWHNRFFCAAMPRRASTLPSPQPTGSLGS